MSDPTPLHVPSTITALGETQLSASGTPAPAPVRSDLGTRYSHVGLLGRGGMGIVERMWDGDLMRDLAVKRIRPDLKDNPALIAQFMWEARVGAYLDHPNIVPVHDLGMGADGPYFTMKRASGRSLAEWLAELSSAGNDDRWPLPRRLRAMRQVCHAVAFAHRRGVLHRDLKPANVLVGEDGEVLVTDWGLALPVPGPAGDALRLVIPAGLDSLSAGTPMYMSPEQARGDALDERSDVFSLGVMLYEVAALERPFGGSSLTEVTDNIEHTRHRPLRELRPDAPTSLEAVIERALAREPADRYASAAALAEDLECVLDGRAPSAEALSIVGRGLRYYLSRDPALDRMRVIDIDLWVASGWLFGISCGLVVAMWLGTWWAAGFAAASLLVCIPPSRRYLTARRARLASGSDDPAAERR